MSAPTPLRHLATTMDYGSLDGAILGRPAIKPSNGDGLLTHHPSGRVLFIENKQPGENITEGQKIALTDLHNLGDKTTVLVVEHSGKKTEMGAFLFDPLRYKHWGVTDWVPVSLEEFRAKLNKWWNKA